MVVLLHLLDDAEVDRVHVVLEGALYSGGCVLVGALADVSAALLFQGDAVAQLGGEGRHVQQFLYEFVALHDGRRVHSVFLLVFLGDGCGSACRG